MRSLYSAIILAGGSGERLGGRDKSAVTVGGITLLDRVLAACGTATERIVVGPEQRGGPVAATAAGLERLSGNGPVALLAADQPFLTVRALGVLADALAGHDGALYVDARGRRQLLCGMWRSAPLRARLEVINPWGASLRQLIGGLDVVEVTVTPGAVTGSAEFPPPWFDCDTPEQLREAERICGSHAGESASGTG